MRTSDVGGTARAGGGGGPAAESSRFVDVLRSARRRAAEPRDAARVGPPEGPRPESLPGANAASPSSAPDPIAPAVASLLRTLPVAAVAAARAPREGSLALSFGRSLHVELRAGPDGIDLVLRPDARLRAAATAELPGLVAALAAHGIRVARAEIRGRAAEPRRGRAR